jgi:hypothetical protein
MFVFGEPKDVAKLMAVEQASYSGPGLPDPAEEWGYEEWRTQLIYTASVLRRAASQGMDEDIVMACCQEYEDALVRFCTYDDVILRAMDNGMHNYPWHDPGAMARQHALASRVWALSED